MKPFFSRLKLLTAREPPVIVGSDCCSKRKQTGRLMNNTPHSSEAGKSKVMAPADWAAGESPSGCRLSSHCSLTAEDTVSSGSLS